MPWGLAAGYAKSKNINNLPLLTASLILFANVIHTPSDNLLIATLVVLGCLGVGGLGLALVAYLEGRAQGRRADAAIEALKALTAGLVPPPDVQPRPPSAVQLLQPILTALVTPTSTTNPPPNYYKPKPP